MANGKPGVGREDIRNAAANGTEASQASTDEYVRNIIQQYRTKLLDLTGRNPLINFRHSERSRSHIRVIDEIPENLFGKLDAGKQFSLQPLPNPELAPRDTLNKLRP